MLELDPNFLFARFYKGDAYSRQRRHDEAITEFQKTVDLSERLSLFLW